MMLDELDRGPRRDMHIKLYERECIILDDLCASYRCSRAAVIGALLRQHASAVPDEESVAAAATPGKRARRA